MESGLVVKRARGSPVSEQPPAREEQPPARELSTGLGGVLGLFLFFILTLICGFPDLPQHLSRREEEYPTFPNEDSWCGGGGIRGGQRKE